MDTQTLYAVVYFTALIAAIIFFTMYHNKEKRKAKAESASLLQEYKAALAGTDKQKALAAGRKYYGHARRNGRLTTYDEQALANDLNTMK